MINGAGVPPYLADIGIVATRRVRDADGRRQLQISDDHRRHGRPADARRAADHRRDRDDGGAAGRRDTVEAGQIVDLPEWKTSRAATIAVGQPARLVLLKPAAEPGKYQVELVLK